MLTCSPQIHGDKPSALNSELYCGLIFRCTNCLFGLLVENVVPPDMLIIYYHEGLKADNSERQEAIT